MIHKTVVYTLDAIKFSFLPNSMRMPHFTMFLFFYCQNYIEFWAVMRFICYSLTKFEKSGYSIYRDRTVVYTIRYVYTIQLCIYYTVMHVLSEIIIMCILTMISSWNFFSCWWNVHLRLLFFSNINTTFKINNSIMIYF